MPDLIPGTKLSRAPEVLFSPLAGGEGVLLSMQAGLYFSLNKTAVVVWGALGTECTLEELAQTLCERFKVTTDQAHADLNALLGEMVERKLVVEKPL